MDELKERRKRAIKKMPIIGKIGVYLWIYKIWFEPRNVKGMYWECNQFNAYNPLTWILILVLIPVGMIKGIIDLFKELPENFNVSKWG